MNLPLPSRSRSSSRLLAAFTLGIAAAAVVPSAAAAVVTINLTNTRNDGTSTNDDTIAGGGAGVAAGSFFRVTDWLGVGTGDLSILNGYSSGPFTRWGFVLNNDAKFSYDLGGVMNLFSGGDVIDGSDFGNPSSSNSYFREDQVGTPFFTMPAFGPNAYLGFRFGSGPSYNYGYLAVSWDGSSNFQITSGAYESNAGQSITIPGGGSSSVPDSGSTGLMGLLFAGAAVRQWRKSRR